MDKKQQEAQKIYDDFTKEITRIMEDKEDSLAKAKMPIKGLGISDTGVTYNDIPFGQLSSSEQLKVSLAIAMALNPKLKVIRITDGSLLDKENMEIIKKMAEEKDYQVWVEKVSDEGEIGFYIEDGEVKSINGKSN
jgi:ABC-type histidine transport system ATPase subunit